MVRGYAIGLGAPDTPHGPLDFGILGREAVAGLLVIVADTAQPTVNRRDGVAIDKIDDVTQDRFGRGG